MHNAHDNVEAYYQICVALNFRVCIRVYTNKIHETR